MELVEGVQSKSCYFRDFSRTIWMVWTRTIPSRGWEVLAPGSGAGSDTVAPPLSGQYK